MKAALWKPSALRLFPFQLCLALYAFACYGQTVNLIPACGKPGDKFCISGSGWAEPNPLCRYLFTMDGQTIAPDQQDGLYGPPATRGTVPNLPDGNHTVLVRLVLNDAGSTLLQQKDAPFKILSAAAQSSVQTAGAGTGTINITYKAPDACETSCKRIVFIQTVRRFVVKNDNTEVITTATDWNIADAAKKAGVETNPGRRRVDNFWGLKPPYYNINYNGTIPAAGGNAGYGQIGSTDPTRLDGSMNDSPSINLANFLGGFPIKEVILRFESAPFCIEGNDAGKYLGWVVTWEAHKTAAGAVTVSNVSVSQGQPSGDFLQAVTNWVSSPDHMVNPPTPAASPCFYN